MMRRLVCRGALVFALGLVAACAPEGEEPRDMPESLEHQLRAFVTEAAREAGFEPGVAVHVDAPALGLAWEGACGLANPSSGEAMTPGHPVRIASNTKTYVAAAVLRLWEMGRLDLDEAAAAFVPAELVAILEAEGYRMDEITIRHLLTHTSGLVDHGAGGTYAEAIMREPRRRWSRTDQIRLSAEVGDPLGAPGEVYSYSDTGYVLLGAVLETVTGKTLAEAVWSVIDREALGLRETWWETLEPRPEGVAGRAHQFYGEADVSGFDPSFDLWGGGGIAATVGDLARFTRALFEGRVFDDPATLDEMLSAPEGVAPAPGADEGSLPPGAYRKGVWVLPREGRTLHRHTGFWGTSATWIPELDLVVTLTVNRHGEGELLDRLQEGIPELVAAAGAP